MSDYLRVAALVLLPLLAAGFAILGAGVVLQVRDALRLHRGAAARIDARRQAEGLVLASFTNGRCDRCGHPEWRHLSDRCSS